MGDKTTIEWTDATWNPVTGCTKVSQGCKHCYAERVFPRAYGKTRKFTDVQCHPERLDQPLRWKKPRRIFVNSMSDLFHENVPDDFIDDVFAMMAQCHQHVFQVLTKRPARMKLLMKRWYEGDWGFSVARKNIWLGVSCEDQATADERIPLLLQTPAAVRFVSAEPLLGPIDFTGIRKQMDGKHINSISGVTSGYYTEYKGTSLDWVIVGGESGPNARHTQPDWVRSIRDQCKAAGVPFFFKQWGNWLPPLQSGNPDHEPRILNSSGRFLLTTKKAAGRELDGVTYSEFPA